MSAVRGSDRPRLVRRARLGWNEARHAHALLLPESVLFLTRSAGEILALCDGTRTVDEVVAALAARYPGAPVARDVADLLTRLEARGLLESVAPTPPVHAPAETPASAPPPATTPGQGDLAPPVALLAELTYRCPLRCGYCSNPTDLARYRDELDTETWTRVFREAAAMGVLQLHLSGGEPLLRPDLAALVHAAREAGLYTNLITSAYGLDDARLDALVAAGLDHVQISFQDTEPARADALAGTAAHTIKLRAARAVRDRGLPLSVNVVLHRGNVDRLEDIIALAEGLGAERLELANTQYHGWALANRDALLPTRASLKRAAAVAAAANARLRGRMAVIYVLPDYYTDVPKPCMDGWGRRFLTVIPDGTALPCSGAHALPLPFDNVRAKSLWEIWNRGEAFDAYRGTAWMRDPCVSCERREIDHGGCRCQAFALTGDARDADPACAKSPAHGAIIAARERADHPPPPLLYRVRLSRART